MIKAWKRFDPARKRAGVCVPLFSIYSRESVGVGEFPDLKRLVDWCKKTNQSILQLLPLNDMGFNFRPYDAESSFALEPMHLALREIRHVNLRDFEDALRVLRRRFPAGDESSGASGRFDPAIKSAKLALLRRMFEARLPAGESELMDFKKRHSFWIDSYADYRVLKQMNPGQSWENWSHSQRPASSDHDRLFYQWLQWQAFSQLMEAKAYANQHDVYLMGDLPFLVARDSADVWANRDCFKLDKSAGAPPDLYLAEGQQWGMPPYDWKKMELHGYDYLTQKLATAENFYDMFRIDHFVGIFRIWTFPDKAFDPPEEALWEAHGRRILEVMLRSTRMLPCAEDLGCIPECSFKLLAETGIPGIDVQRWSRDWKKTKDFLAPKAYRRNACAVISTHDMSPLKIWWETEAEVEEKEKFITMLNDASRRTTGSRETLLKASPLFIKKCLKKINETNAVFSIQWWQDWLSLGSYGRLLSPEDRVNIPGTTSDRFWRLQMPVSLEKLNALPINKVIRLLNKKRS